MQYLGPRDLLGVSADATPADTWDEAATRRALDELFQHAMQFRSSKEYHALLEFVAGFRRYSPFNAMLVYIQLPGARFVAPAHRWIREFGRRPKPGARPLVILQPMGPVMFVFDVSDTEGAAMPREVERPFVVAGEEEHGKLSRTIENAERDGVAFHTAKLGSQQGGSIRVAEGDGRVVRFRGTAVRVRYHLECASGASRESQYATVVHELAHLYCGHLGTPNPQWWPDRRGLDKSVVELEAESVAYLVCARAGISTPSAEYLSGYVSREPMTPSISLDCVMKAAGLIESMGIERLKPRKAKGGT